MKTWILVANAARARLFEASACDGRLSELADFVHPEGRLSGSAFTRGPRPRVQESAASARHAIEPHSDPHDKACTEFARGLAGELDQGRTAHNYDRLVLVAPPRFLGQLRAALDDQVARLVSETMNKDVTQAGIEDIEALLKPRERGR